MIYHCNRCRYDFEASVPPVRCPDCGSRALRRATRAERVEYLQLMKLVAAESWDDAPLRRRAGNAAAEESPLPCAGKGASGVLRLSTCSHQAARCFFFFRQESN